MIVKGAIALALGIVGYCALARSLAIVWANADPVAALNIWSGDARIMAGAAQKIIEQQATSGDRRPATALAQQALMRDGTRVLAADTLGFSSGIAGADRSAADWFAYSERLSRRDLRAQLYFIENSVSEGNVRSALHHYDIALRASDFSAPATLFPILRSAISDPNVRRELARTLAPNPIWTNSFLIDLSNNGPDFAAAAQLLIDIHQLGAPISVGIEEVLLNDLVLRKDVATAWRLYLALHPAADRVLIRNGKFETTNNGNSPFDWQLTSGDGIYVELGVRENRGVLDYRLSPTTAATIARQLIFMSPGNYRLGSVLVATQQQLGGGPFWQVVCADGRSIGKLEMGGPIAEPRSFVVDIVVPSNCSTQLITLTVRASDDVQGATGQVGSLSLSKIQS